MGSVRWKGMSPKNLGEAWRRAGRNARRATRQALRDEAEEIMEISIEQSPVDDGQLEAAHHIEVRQANQNNLGISVNVGGTVDGVDVSAYAMEQHENNGTIWNQGPGTLAKQARTTRRVGAGFLDRAFDERRDPLMEAIVDALFGEFR